MDAEAEAQLAASRARERIAKDLREQMPYLLTRDLNSILDGVGELVQRGVLSGTPAMTAAKSRASFTKLSAELRNQIYELVLGGHPCGPVRTYHFGSHVTVDKGEIVVEDFGGRFRRFCPRRAVPPKIAQTTRQLREEVTSIFYGSNKFVAYINIWNSLLLEGLMNWLDVIGPRNAACVKKLVVRFPDHPYDTLYEWIGATILTKEMILDELGLTGQCVDLASIEVEHWSSSDEEDGEQEVGWSVIPSAETHALKDMFEEIQVDEKA